MPGKRITDQKYLELLQRYKQPPTPEEAFGFVTAVRSGGFDNQRHKDASPKRDVPLGQHGSVRDVPVATNKAEREVLFGKSFQKKLDLNANIVQSDAEHGRSGGTMEALFGLGRYVQFVTKARFIPGPPKGWDGVIRKTMDFNTTYLGDGKRDKGYEGNYGKLKDEIRMTLVCENEAMYDLVRTVVKEIVDRSGRDGMELVKRGETKAEEDDCGYSGTNYVVRLPNSEFGEIQINVPTIMFGKMSAQDYMVQLRVERGDYMHLEHRYGLKGGYGHALYELYRVGKGSTRSDTAKRLSKQYYNLLRLAPNAPRPACIAWEEEVSQWRSSDPVVEATLLHAGLVPEMSAAMPATRGRSTTAYEQATRGRSSAFSQVNARERANAIPRKM